MLRRLQQGRPVSECDEKLLRSLGLIVSDTEREKKRMLKYLNELNRLNRTLSIKLVMSLDCNLACRYCFEGNRKGKFYMSRDTADELVEFIKTRIVRPFSSVAKGRESDREIDEVHIVFYGGEPLLSKELIIHIARKVRAISKRYGLRFGFSLQTNGTLFSKKVADELKPLGLISAFITVDGPMKCHDKSRPYKSGKGSFDLIIRNVKEIAGLVDVQLHGNFTRKNYRFFPALADFLIQNGLGPKKIHYLRFFPVAAESSEILPDFGEGCFSMNEQWLFDASVELKAEVLKRGYRSDRIAPGVCMMEHRNHLLVNYNGDLYKCPGLIGREEFKVGDLKTGVKHATQPQGADNWKNDECLECAYLPLCFGGCRYMKLVRDGNMDGVDCRKAYFDATLEALVKQDIKYRLVGKR